MATEIEQAVSTRAVSRRLSSNFIRNLAQINDTTIVLIVGFVTYYIYVVLMVGSEWDRQYSVSILLTTVVACLMFHSFGIYEIERLSLRQYAIKRILSAWSITFAIILFMAFALKISDYYSRIWAVTWYCTTGLSLLAARLFLIGWIRRLARDGILGERCIIIGAGDLGQRLATQICELKDPFIRVLGFIDDRATRVPIFSSGIKLLGNTQTLLNLIRANKVDQVFVALPWTARERLVHIIRQLELMPVRVSLVSEPLALDIQLHSINYINGTPTLQVLDHPLSGWSNLLKWIEDRVLSALILVFISPLMVLVAIAIKLDSPGPVFFRQKRFGFNNNQIEVLKFRTMYKNCSSSDAPMLQATKNDSRVTRVGRFLRCSSLDELPQFINVILGDMSIVGPRPHAVMHMYQGQRFEEIIRRYSARYRVKPGITGWAQVNGWRGETDTIKKLEKRVEYDLYYIDNWSIWFDILIVLKTIIAIFRNDNVY